MNKTATLTPVSPRQAQGRARRRTRMHRLHLTPRNPLAVRYGYCLHTSRGLQGDTKYLTTPRFREIDAFSRAFTNNRVYLIRDTRPIARLKSKTHER